MNIEHAPLFESLLMRDVRLKNIIAFAPTDMGTADRDGRVTDQMLCHYVARAKGGAGMIIVEHTMSNYLYGLEGSGLLGAHNDRCLSGMADIASAVRTFNAVSIVQLSIGLGRFGMKAVGPSPVPYRIPPGSTHRGFKRLEGRTGPVPRELSTDEIENLENLFVSAVRRIKRAKFKGIEIHGAHGYLLSSFLSPLTNHRTDRYGGSFENRLRLAINLIQRSREVAGDKFIIGFRVSGDEHVEGGMTLDEVVEAAPILERAGIDYIHLSSGTIEAWKHTFPAKDGSMLAEAEAIKQVVSIPVICPSFHDPDAAARAVGEGKVDLVSMSRALIADPQWPNKVSAGHASDIQKCTRSNYCLQTLLQGFQARCCVNPNVGRERFVPDYFPPPRKGGGRAI
jgi:2,4-dienoyl-CoA reductase-like NADH-dependent reductase (Old Yellow Enzyme family)